MSTPATLPADFSGWDQAKPPASPATLPATFDGWDEAKPPAASRSPKPMLAAHPPDELAAQEFAREGLPAASSPGAVPVPKQLQPGTGLPYEQTNDLLNAWRAPDEQVHSDAPRGPQRKGWAYEMGEEPETAQGSIAVSGVKGYPEMYHGAEDLAHAKTRDERYNAGSEIIGGAMTAATPGLIAGLGSAPAATGRALLTGLGAGQVARYMTRKAGGSPAAQNFAEAAGSLIPGAAEMGAEAAGRLRAERLLPRPATFAPDSTPALPAGGQAPAALPPASTPFEGSRFATRPDGSTIDLAATPDLAKPGTPALPSRSMQALPPMAEPTAANGGPARWDNSGPVLMPQSNQVPGIDGEGTTLKTAGGDLAARYRVVEAGHLQPSHNPGTFAPTPGYPEDVQERAYHSSPEAQARVIEQAQNYDPSFTVNSNPDATNGPPIITPDGIVLGGNSRAMSTARLYAFGKGDVYRHALEREAAQFGIDPEALKDFHSPVLVREVPRIATTEEARRVASDLNRNFTGALGANELAVSRGRSISPETLDQAQQGLDRLGENASLADLLREDPVPIVSALQRDGVITDRERPQFLTKAGSLNEAGRAFVQRALLGAVVPDVSVMDSTPPSMLGKVAGSLGDLARLRARGDTWDITPALTEALRERATMATRGLNADTYLGQSNLYGGGPSPVVAALIRALDLKPRAFRAAVHAFTRDANEDVAQQGRLVGIPKPDSVEAFNHAFGASVTSAEFQEPVAPADAMLSITRMPPWALTRAEYLLESAHQLEQRLQETKGSSRRAQQFRQQAADAIAKMREGHDPGFLLDRHEVAVREAVESGKPVPEKVRREYRDFGGSASPSRFGRGPRGPMIAAQWMPHESGPGTMRVDRQGWNVLWALLPPGTIPSYEKFGGLSLSRPAAERLLARLQEEWEAPYIGMLGAELRFAMAMRPHPGGVVFIKVGDDPEVLRRREIEEHAHLLQRDLGNGNALQHLPPKTIDELSSLPAFKTAIRSLKGRYTQVPIDSEDRQALYVAEAGAKLLAGDYEDLGLSEKAGQRARAAYIESLENYHGERRLTEATGRAHPEIGRILAGSPGRSDVAGWDTRNLRTGAGGNAGGREAGGAGRTGAIHPSPDPRTRAEQTKLSLVPLAGKAQVLRELALALEAGDVARATRAVDNARENGITLDPAHVRNYLDLVDKAGKPVGPSTPFPVITGGRAPGETSAPSGHLALVPKPAPPAPAPPLWRQTQQEILDRLGRSPDAAPDFGYHEAAVRDALLRGLPVPVRVLDQYPGLLKLQKQTAGHVLPFPTRRIQPVTHDDGDALARIELARPLKALDAALSKYGGVSPEARAAFKSFEGMRDFRAVEASRLAEALYGSVKRLFGVKTYQDALPHLLKIQRAIVRPNDPKFQLTPAESRVRDLLLKLRDRITQHDLQLGWLTPQQAAARPNYWPGDYTDDIADIARAMKSKGVAGTPSMRPEPENYRGRKFDDFVDGEVSGLHQNPDAVAVLLRRLDRSLQAGNAQDLLHRLGQLGPEEVQQPTMIQYRGRTVPVVPLGYTLASDLPAIRSSLALRELGGDLAVSDRVAGALERVLGTAPEKASRITRFRRAAWSLQRALSFWNLLKHPENVSANAVMAGWTRASKNLVHGNIHGAVSDTKIAASPVGFLLDREVMEGALHQRGKLYDRALKAGAIRSSAGRSLTSFGGGSEVPRLEAVLDEARRSVFGSQGEPLGHRVGRYLGTATNLGHHLVFSFFDTGVRLEMFRQLKAQGLSDEQAAAAVNDALVDYGDVRNTGAAGVFNHVAYTLPWTKGNLRAQALMFRENPVAWMLATGAVLGSLEWENRKHTGHSALANPPGDQDRAVLGPPDVQGNLRYERATLPWLTWEDLMSHPAEFAWNRLDPNLRTGIAAATNEAYPPSVLPNPVTGEAGRRYSVVNDAERAAASAGHPRGTLSSLGRIAARNMLQSLASDIGRLRSGKLPASELLLPISGRTDDPYRDFRNSASDARRIAASVTSRVEQGEPADDLQASLRPSLERAEADLARAVDQLQKRPPAAAADRTKAEQAILAGYRSLEAARKGYVLAELAASIRADDANRAEAAMAFARTNGVELTETDVAHYLSRLSGSGSAAPAVGGHR